MWVGNVDAMQGLDYVQNILRKLCKRDLGLMPGLTCSFRKHGAAQQGDPQQLRLSRPNSIVVLPVPCVLRAGPAFQLDGLHQIGAMVCCPHSQACKACLNPKTCTLMGQWAVLNEPCIRMPEAQT